MFKKAEKSELRTWLLGDVLLIIISMFLTILFVANMIINEEFKVTEFILAIVCACILTYCIIYLVRLLKAYKSFDERKIQEKEIELENEKRIALEKQKKIEKEQQELEEIKRREEEIRKQNLAEIEAKKKEALENEKTNNNSH